MEHLTIYGDFNCPYSYLASARVDQLVARRLAIVEWRAVEHAPHIPAGGLPVAGEVATQLNDEIREVTALAASTPLPLRLPAVLPNTELAVSAWASTEPRDAPQLRRRLFGALWAQRRNIGDPAELSMLTGGREGWQPAVVAHWRAAWLGIDQPAVPLLMLSTGIVLRGADALERLDVIGAGGLPERHRRLQRRAAPKHMEVST